MSWKVQSFTYKPPQKQDTQESHPNAHSPTKTSMLGLVFTQQELTTLLTTLITAISHTPHYALILSTTTVGTSPSSTLTLPATNSPKIQYIPPTPHQKLFPHCSLLIHHGGAGTTHQGLLAGRPTFIIPCGVSSDQYFWGDVVFRAGVGPNPVMAKKVSVEGVRRVLEAVWCVDRCR